MANTTRSELEALVNRPGFRLLLHDIWRLGRMLQQEGIIEQENLDNDRSCAGSVLCQISALVHSQETADQCSQGDDALNILPRVADYVEGLCYDQNRASASWTTRPTESMTKMDSRAGSGSQMHYNNAPPHSADPRFAGQHTSFSHMSTFPSSNQSSVNWPHDHHLQNHPDMISNPNFIQHAQRQVYDDLSASVQNYHLSHQNPNTMRYEQNAVRPFYSMIQSTPRNSQLELPGQYTDVRYDPSSGIVPHIFQTTSGLQPAVRWPNSAISEPHSPLLARPPPSSLARAGSSFRRPSINASPGTDETRDTKALYETFKQHSKPKKFFRIGRVFMVLWTEPLGDERLSESSQFTLKGLYGDWLHQKVRRFIVIAEGEQHCVAIPINSYGNNGVAKKGFNKADHGIVYVGSKPPEPDVGELPGRDEQPMVAIPIRVDPDNPTERLGHKSRIHYSKVYTIEHNVKARSVGMIHTKSMPDLIYQTAYVWSRTSKGLGHLGLRPGRTIEQDESEVLDPAISTDDSNLSPNQMPLSPA